MCCGFGHMLLSIGMINEIFAILAIRPRLGVEQKGPNIAQIRLARFYVGYVRGKKTTYA